MTDTPTVTRRLAAVMALDAVGYSRLMGVDEEGTHERLMSLLRNLLVPLIIECNGRVFKNTGDGALVEFASAVDATVCAIRIQQTMRAHEQDKSSASRVEYRIGVNLGDVIAEPDELYGDSVNVAVRLQALADPGGILVSRLVVEQVGDKRGIKFIDAGAKRLKNIKRPVRLYRVEIPEKPLPAARPVQRSFASLVDRRVIDRPAIAVMPFTNLSGDAADDYFADGLTEDIITALARLRALPVIARNSTFRYRGTPSDVRGVGRELGARYVLEGSVRRAGSRARIVAQLIEAESNTHLFAEQYDRELTDLFEVQDDLITSIVGELGPELLRQERERVASSPHENLDAYDCLQRGLWHHYRYTKEDYQKAEEYFFKALERNPNYALAAASLSISRVHAVMSNWLGEGRDALVEATTFAERAVELDARDPQCHFALGLVQYHVGQIRPALSAMKQAISLNPSHAAAYANRALLLNYVNRPEESLESVSTALRLSPHDIRRFIWITALAGGYYLSGRLEQAVEAGQSGLRLKPDYLHSLTYVVAALGQLERRPEAAAYLSMLRRIHHDAAAAEAFLERYYVDRTALTKIMEGLRKAGFD